MEILGNSIMRTTWQKNVWRTIVVSLGTTTLYGSACNARNVQAVIAGVDAATGQLLSDQNRNDQNGFDRFIDELDRIF